jgi:23S rRNA pseudouridine2457 synthase
MRYIVFNKPYGVLSQFTDDGHHPGLGHYLTIPGIYPVGRLDHDSEGLLLLTDDGALAHRLADPRFKQPKRYWVQVEGVPSGQALKHLETGVVIQGHQTRPAQVTRVSEPPGLWPRNPPIRMRLSVPDSWLSVVITEGRNRQVRRMTAAVGYPTLRLVRFGIGNLTLDELAPGDCRELAPSEVQALRRFQRVF